MSPASSERRVLVAGLGNIFFGDDAFGVEVVRRLSPQSLPAGVRVLDVGIRSLHLAYELLEGDYDTVILVDIVSRGGTPGTVYELEPDGPDSTDIEDVADGHGLRPDQVLAFARRLGGNVGRILIVGCEPACTDPDASMSEPVTAAVDTAMHTILRLATAAAVDPVGAGN